MRIVPLTFALLTTLSALAGCGSGEQSTPAACLNPPAAYVRALRAAPGTVELAAGTPISSCLTKNQSTGDLTGVGTSMIGAATELNRTARANPQGPVPGQLGYLVGAAVRGASDSGGIHSNLIQRLTAAARFSPGGEPLPPGFDAAYGTGYAAGKDHG